MASGEAGNPRDPRYCSETDRSDYGSGRVRIQLLLRSFRFAARWVCLPSTVAFEDDAEARAGGLGEAP